MSRNPLLAHRRIPTGNGYRVPRVFKVEGGLHFIKSNGKPYFSITVDCHRVGFPEQCQSGGAAHGEIERYFPGRFTDLIVLHLSDIDGAPMAAEANGWYDLAGALGGAGEHYHVGNSKRNFSIAPPADKSWQNTEYREPTQAECVQIFADHCRISLADAQAVVRQCQSVFHKDAPRAYWREFCESLRPMWKRQADDCIAAHKLAVFGDAWPVAA